MASATANMDSRSSHTAFFYGTLMAPAVLHRVCHGNSDPVNPIYAAHQFHARPAMLHDHRRHRVKDADYPAVLPCPGGEVRGTVVTGLTDADIWRLDIFEGEEYTREKVKVRPLEASDGQSAVNQELAPEIDAEVYVWKDQTGEDLDAEEWDFSQFLKEKLRFWTGSSSRQEYKEIDEAVANGEPPRDGTGGRGATGAISDALLADHENNGLSK